MFRNRTIIHWILGCSLLMTILAVAPASAQQSFDNVAGSWSGGGSMKPSDGARERVLARKEVVLSAGALQSPQLRPPPVVVAEDGNLGGNPCCHLRQRFVVSRALTIGAIPVHRLGQTFPQTGRGLESEVSLRF